MVWQLCSLLFACKIRWRKTDTGGFSHLARALFLASHAQAAGIDLDLPNAAGFTIRQIVQQQQQAGSQAAAGTRSGTGSPTSSYNSEEAAAAKAAAGAAATSARTRAAKPGVGLHKDEEDDWLDKLAFEMSYDDGGGFHG